MPPLPQPRAVSSLSTPEPAFPFATTTTPRATTRSKRAHPSAAVVARTRRSTRRRLSSEDEVIMRVGVGVAESCTESFPSALRMDSPNRITDELLCS